MKKEKLEAEGFSFKKVTKKHIKEQQENAVKMLNELVKLKIAPSDIHGVGVFAMRDIKKGERLYADAQYQALDVPYKMFKKLRPEIAEYILGRWATIVNGSHFIYPDSKMVAFMNHSDEFNYDAKTDIALVDIPCGIEVTENYRDIPNYEKIFLWLK